MPKAVLSPPNSLTSAILLALIGGLLDAFVYLDYGGVFATAMTGNGVLLGIALLHHDTLRALRHLVPTLAFLAGVALIRLLEIALGSRAISIGILLELGTFFALSGLPRSVPGMLLTGILSFVGAYQVSNFRQVDTFNYSSTFIAGDLRTIGDGLYEIFVSPSSAAARAFSRRKLRDLSLIVLSFIASAGLGALLAKPLGNHTLWFTLPPLAAVLYLSRQHPARPTR